MKIARLSLFALIPTVGCATNVATSGPEEVAQTSQAVSSGPGIAYLGCYADTSTRDLPYQAYSGSSTATDESCLGACASAGYSYAGLQDGNQCFCGNAYGSHGTSTNCNMGCSGNGSETCGGPWANSVYSTGIAYLGCYADSSSRDLPYQAYTGSADTEQSCVAACRGAGYPYAGLQDGNQCFCGSAYGSHGTSTNCNMGCSGNGSETCGGAWANSVYSTGSSLSSSLSASVSVSGSTATVTVTNHSTQTLYNWQVGLNLNGASINGNSAYGGTGGMNNGSVYYNGGLAIVTPANGATLGAGSSTQVSFNFSGSSPSIASVDGISGSSAPIPEDGVDHVARAAATAALNVIIGFESTRTTNDLNDFFELDSHSYLVSSDGSQIVFDPNAFASWDDNTAATSALAAAQTDPSVASYLVTGLKSCFGDTNGQYVYAFNGAALRNWSYTTTAQNVTLNATQGTNNINRVGANVNGTEQITLTETVNANSDDQNFGLVSSLLYSNFDSNTSDSVWTKYHSGNGMPCSPFNGPGGGANPNLIMSVNGSPVGGRQQLPTVNCPAVNNCKSVAVIDPVAYSSPGQFYDINNNLIGPSTNPFALQPNVSLGYNPDHQGQWAQDPAGNWGEFSKKTFSNGSYWYKWNMCASGIFNPNGC